MKIVYLTAGAAGMYCGSCLNDNLMARTMDALGHDVVLVPTYTPIRTDEEDFSNSQVFFGGIEVYLQQKFAYFRKRRPLLDKLLNHPLLLRLASRFSSSTNARDLGELAIAVLEGDHGPLRKETDRLVEWLREFRPDAMYLTNAMFVGLAGRIKDELQIPVLCGLPGEDLFLDDLIEPYRSKAIETLRRYASDVDAFTSPSDYYADHMAEYMAVPREKIHVVPLGLDLKSYDNTFAATRHEGEPFTIGFLARRSPEKGLDLLVEAFIQLALEVGPERVKLRVAGFLAGKDKAWYERVVDRVSEAGLDRRVDWVGEVDGNEKHHFLETIHVFSMPAPYREPKGRSILEAMAVGVPVVQPNHGSFPEIVESTGGGILVKPKDVEALTDGLKQLFENEPDRLRLGDQGRQAVWQHHSDQEAAGHLLDLIETSIRRAEQKKALLSA